MAVKFGIRMEALTLFDSRVERYEYGRRSSVRRVIDRRDGSSTLSTITLPSGIRSGNAADDFDLAWLRRKRKPRVSKSSSIIRTVDLFAGCGGLSIGIAEACRALDLQHQPVLANDIDSAVLDIYSRNLPEAEIDSRPVEQLFDGALGAKASPGERALKTRLGKIDILVGGPPCQGHSTFNNHTRHDDPKNELYLVMARFCEIIRPKHVVIENVPGVQRDASKVAQRTWKRLEELGYTVSHGVVDMSVLGVAQARKRSITLASIEVQPSVAAAVEGVQTNVRPIAWALKDLLEIPGVGVFNTGPNCDNETVRRINVLFDNDLYELPDKERPDCHRLKPHTYPSVYGRLHWDQPSPTITTGFGTMGQGRFVHPFIRRTLTPHEAARLQFFPDFFNFEGAGRSLLHKVIGNAVPPKAGYALGLHLLR